jgi:hypothetical protein
MQIARWIVGTAALVPWLVAQDEKKPTPTYEELLKEFRDAQTAFTAEIRKIGTDAKAAGEKPDYSKAKDPTAGFVPRFVELAASQAGTEAAVRPLVWIVQNDRVGKHAADALAKLADAHAGSKELGTIGRAVESLARRQPDAKAKLDAILDQTPHQDVKVQLLFARATMNSGGYQGGATKEQLAKAKADIETLMQLAPESKAAQDSKPLLFEIESLQPGMTVPEIEGKDLDGAAFKLSDYRGKVVLIDFWGDW